MTGFDAAKKARLIARMRKLPEPVRRNVKAQMGSDAAELSAMQKRLAPVDPQGAGALRESHRYQDVSDESRIAFKVMAGGPTTTRPVRQGQSASFDYANAQEHGTAEVTAQPWFYPSYRAKRKLFRARTSRAAKKGIAEALGS